MSCAAAPRRRCLGAREGGENTCVSRGAHVDASPGLREGASRVSGALPARGRGAAEHLLTWLLVVLSVTRLEAGLAQSSGTITTLRRQPASYVWATKPLVSNTIETDESACEARCKGIPSCLYGTFLKGFGTCWLSDHPPTGALAPCGVRCVSWQRTEVEQTPPPAPPTGSPTPVPPTPRPTPPPTPPPTQPPTPPPTPHPHCMCDPALHPSDFTKCHRGDDNRIRVTHETTHIVGHDGLENQHVCRDVKGKCQCCDCVPQLSLSNMASDIHMLPRGTYTIEPPFLANGQHNIKSNLAECQLACAENEQCTTGTFILSGVDRGECWLAKRHGARQLCTQPCQSFEKPFR